MAHYVGVVDTPDVGPPAPGSAAHAELEAAAKAAKKPSTVMYAATAVGLYLLYRAYSKKKY